MNYVYAETGGFWRKSTATSFAYSDGDTVEQSLLQIISAASDRSVLSQELVRKIHDWPTMYHLHPNRSNLLRPHEKILRNASVLELGGGCGALTRYLGETCARVTMVEGSTRRSAIAAARCKGLENVSIYNDTIMEAALPETSFDVVTLIGVLEYARVYDTINEDPIQAMLERAYSLLSPSGVLVLAFENQLGLKYFAGAPEDHYNIPMYGINDLYAADGIVTFGRSESLSRLRRAGFTDVEEFLPFPDYKLPVLVVHPSAKKIAAETFNLGALVSECIQKKHVPHNFSLENAWGVVCRNGLLWDLSNSFCFLATKQQVKSPAQNELATENVLASHYSTSRKVCFAKQASFVKEGDDILVYRRPLSECSPLVQPGRITNCYPEKEYYRAYSKGSDGLYSTLNKRGWTVKDIAAWSKPLLKYWGKYVFLQQGKAMLPSVMIDCIARNMLMDEAGNITLIDQEWKDEEGNFPLKFLVAYNLLVSLSDIGDIEVPNAKTPLGIWKLTLAVIQELQLKFSEQDQKAFCAWLDRFHEEATGNVSASNVYKTNTLTIRYLGAELTQYIQTQERKIASLNANISTLEKERDALQKIFDKYTSRIE